MDTQKLRMAVLHKAITDLEDVGKTKLQKLCYFLQEGLGVPTKYTFRMHHYGPYSEALDTDISRLNFSGYVDIQPDSGGYGYHITSIDDPEDEWMEVLMPYEDRIDEAAKSLGDWYTSELELAATLHFVKKLAPSLSNDQVVNRVRALKPKFEISKIANLHSRLKQMGYLG